MKKKIMGVILAATLIVSQAVTAFAGSKTSEVVLPNDFAAYYTVTEGTREAFAEAEAVSPQTVDAIMEVNNGSMTLAQLVADMKELLKAEGAAGLKMTEEQVDALAADLGSRTFVTKFFDLEPVNGGNIKRAGNFHSYDRSSVSSLQHRPRGMGSCGSVRRRLYKQRDHCVL